MPRGYYTITRVTDFGPYVTKIILPISEKVEAENVNAGQFSVYTERLDENGNMALLPFDFFHWDQMVPSCGYVTVKDAYPSNRKGERLESGSFITLDVDYGPNCTLSSWIVPTKTTEYMAVKHYEITQTHAIATENGFLSGMLFTYSMGNDMPDVEGFCHGISSHAAQPLKYGYFIPQVPTTEKRPLLIWLHGAGEGGNDPMVAYSANKVTNLAKPMIQEKFGGAYLLVPQTTTFWMNDGTGEYGRTGKSIYVEALKYTIDEFISKNPTIDTNRIYIGGDSNGGFMTMRMCIDYPGFFAAAFPICEALYDETISDAQIEELKKLPIWFTHAKNDPVVNPIETAVATYKRLKAAGAENIHFTYWDNIKDIHEGFKDQEGNPYEYLGHFAWIPFLNDDCDFDFDDKPVFVDEKRVTLLDWLALQKK